MGCKSKKKWTEAFKQGKEECGIYEDVVRYKKGWKAMMRIADPTGVK